MKYVKLVLQAWLSALVTCWKKEGDMATPSERQTLPSVETLEREMTEVRERMKAWSALLQCSYRDRLRNSNLVPYPGCARIGARSAAWATGLGIAQLRPGCGHDRSQQRQVASQFRLVRLLFAPAA